MEPSSRSRAWASSRAMSSVSACASRSAFSLSTSALHWRSSFESSVTSWPTSADLPSARRRAVEGRWSLQRLLPLLLPRGGGGSPPGSPAAAFLRRALVEAHRIALCLRAARNTSARPLSSGARFGCRAEVGPATRASPAGSRRPARTKYTGAHSGRGELLGRGRYFRRATSRARSSGSRRCSASSSADLFNERTWLDSVGRSERQSCAALDRSPVQNWKWARARRATRRRRCSSARSAALLRPGSARCGRLCTGRRRSCDAEHARPRPPLPRHARRGGAAGAALRRRRACCAAH